MGFETHAPVAIVGCGLIGVSWAALFQHHGFRVRAWDPDPAVRARLIALIEGPAAQLASLGGEATGSLQVFDSLSEALEGAAFIQENAPENIPQKHELYAQIEAESTALIASSSSALSWSELSAGMKTPAQLITAHPFNPPHLVPLVELYGPDPMALDRAEAIYRALDRVPVRLRKEAVGHIANRLSSALWREAVNIVAEGIADVGAVDTALVNGPGLRWSVMGTHMTYHLGGGAGGMEAYLQHLGPSQERRWAELGEPTLSTDVKAALVAGVAEEAQGRSVAELEAIRDAALIRALKARE